MNPWMQKKEAESGFTFFYIFLCRSAEKLQPYRWSKEISWAIGLCQGRRKAGERQRRASIQHQHQHLLPGVQPDLQHTRTEPIPARAASNRRPADWTRAWGPAAGRWEEMRRRSLDGWTLRWFAGLTRTSLPSSYMQLQCAIRFFLQR